MYVLRVVLSVAVLPMQTQFGWSEEEKGVVLSSFFGGYLVLQVAGGYLSSKFGGKRVFGLGVLVPSLLTAIIPPGASSLVALVVLRVLTGVGESVTYPSVHAMLGRWVPAKERATIVGFVFSGAYLGTVAAFPLASSLVVSNVGWPSVFYVAGAAGCLWSIFWWWIAANDPATDRAITAEERRYIESNLPPSFDGSSPVPWIAILSSGALWSTVAGHFAHNFLFYGLLTLLPSYMKSALGFDLDAAGFLSELPFLGCFLGSVVAGRLADWLIHSRGWPVAGTRRLFQTGLEFVAAACLLAAGYSTDVSTAVVCVTAAVTLVGAGSAGGYAPNLLDLSSFYGGILMSVSNTVATVPGIIAPLIAGAVVTSKERTPETIAQWRTVFWIIAGIVLAGNTVFAVFVRGSEIESLRSTAGRTHVSDEQDELARTSSTSPLMESDGDVDEAVRIVEVAEHHPHHNGKQGV